MLLCPCRTVASVEQMNPIRWVLCYVALVAAMALAVAGISSGLNGKVRCDFCIEQLPDLQAGER